jgi:hypothetical protein
MYSLVERGGQTKFSIDTKHFLIEKGIFGEMRRHVKEASRRLTLIAQSRQGNLVHHEE